MCWFGWKKRPWLATTSLGTTAFLTPIQILIFFFFFNISFHTFFDQSDGTDGSAFFFEAEWCRYSRPDRSSAAHLKPVSLWLVVYPVLLGISRPRFTKISLRYLCPSKLMDSMADARLSVFILFLPISKLCGSHLGISTLGDLIAIKT